jgi:hypothetical protein
MLEVIGSNFLIIAVGAMFAFMGVLVFVSVTDRDPQAD